MREGGGERGRPDWRDGGSKGGRRREIQDRGRGTISIKELVLEKRDFYPLASPKWFSSHLQKGN